MEKFLYVSFTFILLLTGFSIFVTCQNKFNELPNCNFKTSHLPINSGSRELFIVSTLDGKISAIDSSDGGKLIWSHDTEPGALLSSSISKLELSNNGEIIQMIPSLDGNLYIFNGKTIEPIPVLLETLLQHSYKFGDNNVITGGKETSSYGINPYTGQIHYICNMAGCSTLGESVSSNEQMFLLKRHTQVLRSVDSRTGVEKWNFSVGEHHLSLIEGVHSGCGNNDQNEIEEEISEDNIQIKVIISDGVITMIEKTTGNPVWSYKLNSPIVNLWKFRNGLMEYINLFDPKIFSDEQNPKINFVSPLLYLGIHDNQLYIQHSKEVINSIFSATKSPFGSLSTIHHFQWKPYLITASSRTPYINLGIHEESDLQNHIKNSDKTELKTAMILKSDQLEYPYDSGYYLYEATERNRKLIDAIDNTSQCEREEESFPDIIFISGSLWDYWKEVAAISLATAILLNIICWKYITRVVHQKILNEASQSQEYKAVNLDPSSNHSESKTTVIEVKESLNPELNTPSFVSRFQTDFDLLQCLGRGGFGVVYEARNKIDDCSYAVKRIALPNREDAQEKVRREVKALAKLDHTNIVRYFHTWLEYPPSGWQDEKDKEFEISETQSTSHVSASPVIKLKNALNPLKLSEEHVERSFGFILSKSKENSNSFTNINSKNTKSDESFEIVFQNSERKVKTNFTMSEKSISKTSSEEYNKHSTIPFQRYKDDNDNTDDLFVEFIDSGCAENSDCEEEIVCHKQNVSEVEEKVKCQITTRPDKLEINKDITYCKIPKVYLYIQMQLCQKETLKDWLNNTLQREREIVLDIFDQIVSAVEYVHDKGLMHRDLKPSNIFFSLDGLVKVGDFGLVTAMTENDLHTPAGKFSAEGDVISTRHTNNVGTQLYMSPEQIAGKSYSHKVDIFSLGLILFELLYPLNTHMERVQTLLGVKEQIFPKSFKEECPEECELVEKLVSPNPEERLPASVIRSHSLFVDFHPQTPILLRGGRQRTSSCRLSSGSDYDTPLSNPINC